MTFGKTEIVSGFVFFLVLVNGAFGSQSQGNSRDGEVGIVTCRNCHQEKGKSALYPSEKTKEEWEKYFANNCQLLKDLNHNFKEAGISKRQLEHIRAYLVESAGSGSKKADDITTPIDEPPDGVTVSHEVAAAKSESNQPVVKEEITEKKSGDGEAFDPDAGDLTKGRYVLQKCQNCHKKHNAPRLSPADKIKDQWSRYFLKDYSKLKKAMPDFDSYGFTTSQLQNLHQFLRKYALDSDKPMTCN